jgi:hypothetical protein
VLSLVSAADVTKNDPAMAEIRELITTLEPAATDVPSVDP